MNQLANIWKSKSQATGGRWIITGGGFIGSRIAHALISRGEEDVTVCDVVRRKQFNKFLGSKTKFVHTDFTTPEGTEKFRQTIRGGKDVVVIHTAAKVSAQNSKRDQKESYFVNVLGTKNVIKACEIEGVERLVYLSSIEVIHRRDRKAENLTENEPYVCSNENGYTNYARTKALAEQEILSANKRNGISKLKTIAIRPNLVMGENDLCFISGLLGSVIPGLAVYPTSSTALKDVNSVENVANAVLCSADTLNEKKSSQKAVNEASGQAFNLAEGPFSLPDLLFHAAKRYKLVPLPLPYPLIYGVGALADSIRLFFPKFFPFISRASIKTYATNVTANGEKAKRIIGYRPVVTTDEALDIYKSLVEEEKKMKKIF